MIGYEDVIGYKSPIEEIIGKVQIKHDDAILKAVQNVGIKVDKNELEKALKYDRDQYDHGYNKGLFDGYEKGKKETALEILRKAEKKAHFVDGGHYGKDRYELDLDYLKAIIKKDFGVEVEE